MYRVLLQIILLANLMEWIGSFTVPSVEFMLLDNKFRLSLPNDPDMKWVAFNVNINKEFRSFESGQLTGVASVPENQKWSYEFEKKLKDTDIIYIWLAVQYKRLIFRNKENPISVQAFKSGDNNNRLTTTTLRIDIDESEREDLSDDYSTPIKQSEPEKENKICFPTATEVPKSFGGPYCRNDLIFSDNFDTLNTQYWTNEVRIPPTIDDAEFVVYNGTVGVNDGILKIEASLNEKRLKKDTIDLGARCTSTNVESECFLVPQGVLILPPITSGRLSTKKYFNFKYGRIDVRAKLPKGDWLFPLISLQPTNPIYGEHYKSGEIRVAYARGNRNLLWQNKNIDGSRLFGGVILNNTAEMRHLYMKDITLPNVKHFGDQFHLYSLTWKPDELLMAVDGNEYGRIKTNFKEYIHEPIWKKGERNAPLDQMFYITLGLAAGGNGDFPQTQGVPWVNTDPRGTLNFYRSRNLWFPTWSQPTLEVDYVRVYAV